MNIDEALKLSWERLNALADAHQRREAEMMRQLMIAAQGDDKSWNAQMKRLKQILKNG